MNERPTSERPSIDRLQGEGPRTATRSRRCAALVCWTFLVVVGLLAGPSIAAERPIAAASLKIQTDHGRAKRVFLFEARDRRLRLRDFDPRGSIVAIIVNGIGDESGASGRIELDPARWVVKLEDDEPVGFKYIDRTASRGGVRKVVWKNDRLKLKARGANWPWKLRSSQDQIWIHVITQDATFCAGFDAGADVRRNKKGRYRAEQAPRPVACLDQICGNGIEEPGEQCDDGNNVDDDGCSNLCTIGTCGSPDYANTYDAIQAVIFEEAAYQCTNNACHGTARSGALDLRAPQSFDELSTRLVPGDASTSLIWQKIAERTLGAPDAPNQAMPIGGSAVTVDELDALAAWIDAGAERDAVVPGTDDLLGVCLPAPDPIPIPIP